MGLSGTLSDDRRRAADAWCQIALGEHASVPSFAKFVLELVAVGAPPGLLERAAAAIADEVRHARMAFDMATELLGRPVGPSSIDVAGAVTRQPELAEVCLATFSDGCIEEGIAAEQARLAAALCSGKPARIWTTVAAEEESHAELAWSAVEWMLSRQPDLAERMSIRLEQIRASLDETVIEEDREGLIEFGILPRRRMLDVARSAFTEQIYPRAQRLLAGSARMAAA